MYKYNVELERKLFKIIRYLTYLKHILKEDKISEYDYKIYLMIEFLKRFNIDEFLVNYDEFIDNIKKINLENIIIYSDKLRLSVKDFLELDDKVL
jgi:hypothetical protein